MYISHEVEQGRIDCKLLNEWIHEIHEFILDIKTERYLNITKKRTATYDLMQEQQECEELLKAMEGKKQYENTTQYNLYSEGALIS